MWILMCKLKLLYGIIGMDKEILFYVIFDYIKNSKVFVFGWFKIYFFLIFI